MKYTAIVNGKTYEVEIERASTGRSIGHAPAPAAAPAPAPEAAPAPAAAPAPVAPAPAPAAAPSPAANGGAVVSPMPGSILDVHVKPGDTVAEGQVVVTLEAMKMEIEVKAENAGVVSAVNVKKGDMVESGSVLVTL